MGRKKSITTAGGIKYTGLGKVKAKNIKKARSSGYRTMALGKGRKRKLYGTKR